MIQGKGTRMKKQSERSGWQGQALELYDLVREVRERRVRDKIFGLAACEFVLQMGEQICDDEVEQIGELAARWRGDVAELARLHGNAEFYRRLGRKVADFEQPTEAGPVRLYREDRKTG